MIRTCKAGPQGYIQALEGIGRKTLVYGEHMLCCEFQLDCGKVLPLHSHKEEQAGYLVSGHIVLNIGGKDYDMRPGDAWAIPGGIAEGQKDAVMKCSACTGKDTDKVKNSA